MAFLKYTTPKFFLSLFAFFSISTNALAGPPVFFSWGGETIEKIADFPRTIQFQNDKKHFDPGIRYKQIEIFFLPILQYDFKYCGVVDGEKDSYLDFSKKELKELADIAHIKIPDSINLGFWKEWGGKIVLILLAVIYFGYRHYSSKLENQTKE